MLSNKNSFPSYSFPELRNAEIIQCLEDLKMPITESDLSKPSPNIALRIFETFTEIFFGELISPIDMENLPKVELLSDSIKQILVFGKM